MLDFLRNLKFIMRPYHFALALFGAVLHGFPSRRMTVIGITGTKGKTTTSYLLYQILNKAGHKTGLASTALFGIGEKTWPNDTKQTMLGRFALQKLLAQMADARCEYAVVETSSEGILQYRHRFIDYNAALFTNLSPEHIERHRGFENYRAAKVKLFEQVARRIDGIGVYNFDDENIEYFLKPAVKSKYGFSLYGNDARNVERSTSVDTGFDNLHRMTVSNIRLSEHGAAFKFDGKPFQTRLLGAFNVQNAAAAISAARALGIPVPAMQQALKTASAPPGRMEEVPNKKGIKIFIDYSYEPKGLEEALKTVKFFKPKRTLVLIGSAGGGRDRWRRPVMAQIADKYADIVVVTTDDPYDENPDAIIGDIMPGIMKNKSRVLGKNVFKITDRRSAIKKMIELAKKGDAVLFAGKGGETSMAVAGGRKIPWDERKIVEEAIKSAR